MSTLDDTDELAFLDDIEPLMANWPPPADPEPEDKYSDPLPPAPGKEWQRTSETIGRTLHDIETGKSAGDFPAMEHIIRRQHRHHRHTGPIAPKEGPMIQDIFPSVPERLYGVERDVHYLRAEFRQHREESIRKGEQTASKEELQDLKAAVGGINKRLDARTAWAVLQTAALILSSAYALLLTYQHFMNKV